jgi:hypothetical protein
MTQAMRAHRVACGVERRHDISTTSMGFAFDDADLAVLDRGLTTAGITMIRRGWFTRGGAIVHAVDESRKDAGARG